jgi:hypothetical protein
MIEYAYISTSIHKIQLKHYNRSCPIPVGQLMYATAQELLVGWNKSPSDTGTTTRWMLKRLVRRVGSTKYVTQHALICRSQLLWTIKLLKRSEVVHHYYTSLWSAISQSLIQREMSSQHCDEIWYSTGLQAIYLFLLVPHHDSNWMPVALQWALAIHHSGKATHEFHRLIEAANMPAAMMTLSSVTCRSCHPLNI